MFLGVKAHSLTALAPQLTPLLGPDTIVVSTQNGIPWWYFQSIGGDLEGLRLERVDPGGVITAAIEPRRVVGSLAYFAADVIEPGVIRHTEGNKISFGEPDGSKSERLRRIAEPLIAAGFRCPINARFRHEIWVKLLGNVAFNPISALTGGTLEELVRHPDAVARDPRDHERDRSRGARSLASSCRSRSINGWRAPKKSARTRRRCSRISRQAGRWSSRPSSARSSSSADRLDVPIPTTRAVYACAKMLEAKRSAVESADAEKHDSQPSSDIVTVKAPAGQST